MLLYDRWTEDLLRIDRSRIRRVIEAITGYCELNGNLNKLRLSDTGRMLGDYEVAPSVVAAVEPLERFLAGIGRLS